MKGKNLVSVALLLLSIAVVAVPAGAQQYGRFLTLADVEKVTGLKGVTPVPQNPDADGDLNFASHDGKLILSVTFLPASAYVGYKASKEGFKSAISGVGEEGFIGPAGSSPSFILVFKKGAYSVMLNTEPEGNTTRLPIEKLMELAKIIASRM
jgi:hypothetical protein